MKKIVALLLLFCFVTPGTIFSKGQKEIESEGKEELQSEDTIEVKAEKELDLEIQSEQSLKENKEFKESYYENFDEDSFEKNILAQKNKCFFCSPVIGAILLVEGISSFCATGIVHSKWAKSYSASSPQDPGRQIALGLGYFAGTGGVLSGLFYLASYGIEKSILSKKENLNMEVQEKN